MTTSPTTPGVAVNPGERRRALRRACLAAAPEVFYAARFLARPRREEVHALAAVLAQLHQIMIPAEVACEGPSGGGPAAEGAPAGGEALCSSNPADCQGCGESVPQRRAVCSAVIDHLLACRPTGKPELDGFGELAAQGGLQRADLEQYCDALATQATLPRYATWKRLRALCDQGGGSIARLALGVLGRGDGPDLGPGPGPGVRPTPSPEKKKIPGGSPVPRDEAGPPLPAVIRDQVTAWGAALRLARLLERVGRDVRGGHLMLPLDDLVRFGVKESEVVAMSSARALFPDATVATRWAELMTFEAQRARRLYEGGVGCLTVLDGPPRRAVAMLGEIHMARLERLERNGFDVFADPLPTTLWDRLVALPAAVRMAGTRRVM